MKVVRIIYGVVHIEAFLGPFGLELYILHDAIELSMLLEPLLDGVPFSDIPFLHGQFTVLLLLLLSSHYL